MKQLQQLTSLIVIIILVGCSNKNQNVNGHWHSLTPEIGSFKTLDIDDSVIVLDKFEIQGSKPNWVYRKDKKSGRLILPFQEHEYTDKYRLTGDTLIIGDIGFEYKYLKSEIKDCELRDRYVNSVINITLPESQTSTDYDELAYCVNMYIGKSRRQFNENHATDSFQKLLTKYPDSVFIQVWDVLTVLNDIPLVCNSIKDTFPGDEQPNLVLHADTYVDDIFFNRILDKIPRNFIVYRAVNKDGQLRVSRINPY